MIDIYYVEDDKVIAQAVKDFLGQRGYRISVFPTVAGAKEALRGMRPTLVLVDWNMPDGSGNLLVRWIRSKWKDLPVIFLTVRGDSCDIVSGFENGADDYVVKPFELDILLSRIKALLRRMGDVSKQYLSCGSITLDLNKMSVYNNAEEISLSPSEYQLLLYLLQNKGKTVTRRKILEEIWDSSGNYVNDNTLTVTMKRLREKLHQPASLKTVRSVGYRMEETE
ncbi:response regulator transcription factor [Parablautia muri]|uniref:Stage 0 sporulation protein A homolog n=1 Tax=Parablautia muri TaxID=2320879 RepID=A0A9X5GSJ4_9FIRM|nr:response regulator transcription factor [Parablautia muri]NBJ93010.1 DNA-binding response regulator [Parablautia muri]